MLTGQDRREVNTDGWLDGGGKGRKAFGQIREKENKVAR